MGTAARQSRRSSAAPVAWRWTARETSTSPIPGNQRIRKIDSTGTVTTIAGTGAYGFSQHGRRRSRQSRRELYATPVAWRWTARETSTSPIPVNQRIRKVDLTGTITTIAGTGSSTALSGDGGPAVEAANHDHLYQLLLWRGGGQLRANRSTSPMTGNQRILQGLDLRIGERSPPSRGPESTASAGTGVRSASRPTWT